MTNTLTNLRAAKEIAQNVRGDYMLDGNDLEVLKASHLALIASLEAQPEPIYQACMNVGGLTYAWVDVDAEFYEASKERNDLKTRIVYTHAQPVEQPLKEPVGNAQSLTDDLMDCVDRLGSEAETVDPRVWDHLRVYFPVQPIKQHKPTGWVSPKGHYAVPVLFNPYTGEPRDVRNVASDPQGILIVPPGKVEMLAAKKPQSIEPPSTCGACKHFKQGKNPAVGVYEMACFECSQYYPDKYESRAIEQAIRSKQA